MPKVQIKCYVELTGGEDSLFLYNKNIGSNCSFNDRNRYLANIYEANKYSDNKKYNHLLESCTLEYGTTEQLIDWYDRESVFFLYYIPCEAVYETERPHEKMSLLCGLKGSWLLIVPSKCISSEMDSSLALSSRDGTEHKHFSFFGKYNSTLSVCDNAIKY